MTEEAAEDVENLLESYFAQVDAQYDKLRNIGEYIEDTEVGGQAAAFAPVRCTSLLHLASECGSSPAKGY